MLTADAARRHKPSVAKNAQMTRDCRPADAWKAAGDFTGSAKPATLKQFEDISPRRVCKRLEWVASACGVLMSHALCTRFRNALSCVMFQPPS